MIGLFSLWLFTLCFEYKLLGPSFTYDVGISITPDRLVFVVIILVYLYRWIRSKNQSRPITILEYLMLLFAIVATVSWKVGGADSTVERYRALTTLFTICYQPFLTYYIVSRVPYSRPAVGKLFRFLCALGTYLAFTGIFEHFGINSLVFPKYILDPTVGIQFERARGPFASSVVNGGALLVTFLALMFTSSLQTGLKGLLTWSLILPFCITIYFTETRSIWLAFAVILVIVGFFHSNMQKSVKPIIILGVLAFLTGIGSKFSLFDDSLFSRRSETVEYRYANYATILNMVGQHPYFGIGYGNFDKVWQSYFATDFAVSDLKDGNHSMLLGILGELGMVGFCLYGAILAFAFHNCISTYRSFKDDDTFERTFVLVALGTLSSFFIIGITSDLRFHPLFNVALFMFLGKLRAMRATSPTLPAESSATNGITTSGGPRLPGLKRSRYLNVSQN